LKLEKAKELVKKNRAKHNENFFIKRLTWLIIVRENEEDKGFRAGGFHAKWPISASRHEVRVIAMNFPVIREVRKSRG
jgi:hypothetical protein